MRIQLQVKFEFWGDWSSVTDIEDKLWDEEVKAYKLEQAVDASRKVAQQNEAQMRAKEMSEARVMQQGDTNDNSDSDDDDPFL